MVIGFDAKRAFQNTTGLGNYSRMLICGLAAQHRDVEIVLYSPQMSGYYKSFFTGYANVSTRQPHGFDKHLPSLWRGFGVTMHLTEDKVQLYHGLSHELPHRIPSRIKKVVTMHDLIAWRHPEYFSAFDAKVHQIKQQHSCNIADVVVAISKQTKQDLMEIMHVPEEKIKVLYQSCDPIFWQPISDEDLKEVKEAYKLPDNYILCVGTIEDRKNQAAVVNALSQLPSDLHLVIVGKPHGKYYANIEAQIKHQHLENRVHIITDADFEDFPAIYANSRASVYVSKFEGFGIPILEAMCSGTPVLTSNCSSMPEVGGDAVLYADPNNVEEIADQIRRITSDEALRSDLLQKANVQKQKFSQKQVIDSFYNLYRDTLNIE